MGALLLGGVASFILWFLAFRYKARSPEDVPPDAPRPGLIPSALLRTPSWSKLMLISTGVIVTGLTLYSFIPLDYLSQTPVVQSPSLDGVGINLLYGLKLGSSFGYSSTPRVSHRLTSWFYQLIPLLSLRLQVTMCGMRLESPTLRLRWTLYPVLLTVSGLKPHRNQVAMATSGAMSSAVQAILS